jgi:hypothetical protein
MPTPASALPNNASALRLGVGPEALDGDSFVLDSINSERRATAMSAAAHSLYEQSDPERAAEPEGVLLVRCARYEEIDDRRPVDARLPPHSQAGRIMP